MTVFVLRFLYVFPCTVMTKSDRLFHCLLNKTTHRSADKNSKVGLSGGREKCNRTFES